MRVFVTGATGFIGQHVVPLLLQANHDVLILSRNSVQPQGQESILQGDLQNLHAIKGAISEFQPEACIHLAWEGIPDYTYEVSKRNLDASLSLINFLVGDTACRKIIASGSSWEYGKTRGLCKESDRVLIRNPFTWAKHALQLYGTSICALKHVDFIWLRLFFAFGPGQKAHSLIPTLYRAIRRGETPDIRAPHNAQDFIYVEDAARAFLFALHASVPLGIYNVGRSQAIQVADICKMVETFLQGASAFKLQWANPRDATRTWADTKKLNAIGWYPQVTVEQGIQYQIHSLEQI